MSEDFSGDYDAEMQKIYEQKFRRLSAENKDPQKRAQLLMQQYVKQVDIILSGNATEIQFEELEKIKSRAKFYGLKFGLEVSVEQISNE